MTLLPRRFFAKNNMYPGSPDMIHDFGVNNTGYESTQSFILDPKKGVAVVAAERDNMDDCHDDGVECSGHLGQIAAELHRVSELFSTKLGSISIENFANDEELEDRVEEVIDGLRAEVADAEYDSIASGIALVKVDDTLKIVFASIGDVRAFRLSSGNKVQAIEKKVSFGHVIARDPLSLKQGQVGSADVVIQEIHQGDRILLSAPDEYGRFPDLEEPLGLAAGKGKPSSEQLADSIQAWGSIGTTVVFTVPESVGSIEKSTDKRANTISKLSELASKLCIIMHKK